MPLSISEKIKVIMKRRNLTMGDLAQLTGQSRQNLSNKISRDNFTEEDARKIAEALNCDFDSIFTLRDTSEKI